MNKKFFAGVLASCMLFSSAFAQDAGEKNNKNLTLTIEDSVELALQNNISIKQSKLSLDLLEKQNKYSWNSVSPTLSVGGGFTDSLPVDGSENAESYSITGSASLRLSPSLYTTMKSAKLAYENGEISYDTAVKTVEMNVRLSFYSLLNDQETIESNQKTLDAAKRTYESNLEKYNRGQLDQLTLLTSQYNYESKIPSVESAKNSYQNALDTFKQVLGLNLTDEVTLSGSLDDVLNVQLDESILQQSLDEIPSVKSINQSIKSAENSLLATRFSAYGPTVSLSYTYSGGANIEPMKTDYATRASTIGVNVSIPLDGYLPWSSGALSVESQKSNLENLKLQLENAKTTAAITVRNSFNTISYAQSQLKIYESNLDLMQRTYDMTLIAYNNGSKDLSALQTAQDNLFTARRSVQTQRYSIINQVLNLENTLGVPFGTFTKK